MKKLQFLLPALLLFLASCNSTKITSSWKSDEAPQKNYKKIMVLGILKQKDRSLREELEKQLVSNLNSNGYAAVSAMDEYGPKAFDKIREEDIADKLKSSGYDAVITTVLLDKSKDQYYQPGRVSYQPIGIRRFGRYYTTIYDRVYDPGYYTNSTQYFLESNMYDTQSGDLIYSVQSKAADPSSIGSLSKDYSKTIVKDLKQKKVLSQ
jgi:hypothetical protein